MARRDSLAIPLTTCDEFRAARGRLKVGAAPGLDDIPAGLLSSLGDIPLRRIYHILCARIQGRDRSLVEAWAHTLRQAVPKPGKPHTVLAHWRPIQVVAVVSKRFELALWAALERTAPPVHASLVGFSPRRQPQEVTGSLATALRKSQEWRLPPVVASCDVAGAFDNMRLPHVAEALRQQRFHPAHVSNVLQGRMFAKATPWLGAIDAPAIRLRRGCRHGAPKTPSLRNRLLGPTVTAFVQEVGTGGGTGGLVERGARCTLRVDMGRQCVCHRGPGGGPP